MRLLQDELHFMGYTQNFMKKIAKNTQKNTKKHKKMTPHVPMMSTNIRDETPLFCDESALAYFFGS